jgi:hypothetical protein
MNVIDMITAVGQVQARGGLQPAPVSPRSATDFAAALAALQLAESRSGTPVAAISVAPAAVPVPVLATGEADASSAPTDSEDVGAGHPEGLTHRLTDDAVLLWDSSTGPGGPLLHVTGRAL